MENSAAVILAAILGGLTTVFIQHLISEKLLDVTWEKHDRIFTNDKDSLQNKAVIFIHNPNKRVASLMSFNLIFEEKSLIYDASRIKNKFWALPKTKFKLLCGNNEYPLDEVTFINSHNVYPLEIRYDLSTLGALSAIEFKSNACGNIFRQMYDACGRSDKRRRMRTYISKRREDNN